ncbi:hypothetical protein ABDJ41_16815 [Pedobacter sp. ASV1-7]
MTINFSNLFLYTAFELNKKYIAAEFCENKAKPELHCEGKCYLMKKLKQAEEKEQKQERQSQNIHFQEALVVIPMVFKQFPLKEMKLHIPASMGIPQNIENSVFQPPKV